MLTFLCTYLAIGFTISLFLAIDDIRKNPITDGIDLFGFIVAVLFTSLAWPWSVWMIIGDYWQTRNL